MDDSAFMRKLISDFLMSHPNIEVIGTARNGKVAIEKVAELKPDVITMDIEMPIMNGLEALQEIMEKHPTPVVMLSSTTRIGAENTMLAMEYGAVDFVAKPGGAISLNLYEVKDEIVKKVAVAAGVRVSNLTRQISSRRQITSTLANPPVKQEVVIPIVHKSSPRIDCLKDKITKTEKTFVIIGTSTGGPRALQEVLTQLPATIKAPILIVQHMPPGFTKSLANRLNGLSDIAVKEAEEGEPIVNGVAYIAPGGKHLTMRKTGMTYAVHLDETESPRMGHRPSVDVLLESASRIADLNFLTIIMTGMGYDGKKGTELLKKNGRTVTIAESATTAVVYGMPKSIVEAGLADEVVDVQHIAEVIMDLIKS